MGRHKKTVLESNGIDRRSSGYYATPDFVSEFLANALIECSPKASTVFDPCVGKGELTTPFRKRGLRTTGVDIMDMQPDVDDFTQCDFLEWFKEQNVGCLFRTSSDMSYDIYVANPPYNCHEIEYIRENKDQLAALLGRSSVLNMYSLFLSAIIDCAKPGALIGVITHDSFLSARGHKPLREKILRMCSLHYLLLCPTDLFLRQGADVRTCILILQKGKEFQGLVKLLNRPKSTPELRDKLRARAFHSVALQQISLSNRKDNREFLVGVPDQVAEMFSYQRVGEAFQCITGISTGNDSKYLSRSPKEGFSVPFYKNPASRRFYADPDAFLADDFLNIDKAVSNFMVRNKHLLFHPGITCSSMGVTFGAAYLPTNSTYGVNPNIILDDKNTWWLLAYLNSSLASFIVRGILLRSNMVTSGYVSRVPLPPFSQKTKTRIADLARLAYERRVRPSENADYVRSIDALVEADLDLSEACVKQIRSFGADIIRNT